jgi:hypothetical protein
MGVVFCALFSPSRCVSDELSVVPTREVIYYLTTLTNGAKELQARFNPTQLQILEKLNRCDLTALAQLTTIVAPESWFEDELRYSPLPLGYERIASHAKFLIIHQPSQVFGGYEYGRLTRWGPVNTGKKSAPTPSGLFHLNWRSQGRHSTVDPDWFMPWYFNFHNRLGLSLHEYSLPGYPASHACVRLLKRDAQWLYGWGEGWELDAKGWNVVKQGTPVLIVGNYDFDAPPPWRSLHWLARGIELPAQPQEVLMTSPMNSEMDLAD